MPKHTPAMKIAFQGAPGAYSHLACKNFYPQMTPIACANFQDTFSTLAEGKAERAILPIANSLGGRVSDVHRLLPDHHLYIVAEHFQPVHHQLLGVKGAKLSQLKQVRSHPQALAQCHKTLHDLRIEAVKEADTAGAAQQIAQLGDPSVGAIASQLAAEIYGLDILRSRLEDKIGNITRFIVLAPTRNDPEPFDGPHITSFIFTARSVPASLYKCLGGFATNGIDFINIESYVSISNPSKVRFYAEIIGHPAEKAVDQAFEELQFFTVGLKILGSYAMDPLRLQV